MNIDDWEDAKLEMQLRPMVAELIAWLDEHPEDSLWDALLGDQELVALFEARRERLKRSRGAKK